MCHTSLSSPARLLNPQMSKYRGMCCPLQECDSSLTIFLSHSPPSCLYWILQPEIPGSRTGEWLFPADSMGRSVTAQNIQHWLNEELRLVLQQFPVSDGGQWMGNHLFYLSPELGSEAWNPPRSKYGPLNPLQTLGWQKEEKQALCLPSPSPCLYQNKMKQIPIFPIPQL